MYLYRLIWLDIRLDNINQFNIVKIPVSPKTGLVLHRYIANRDAEKLGFKTALQIKHEANNKLIKQIPTNNIIDKLVNYFAKKLFQLKFEYGIKLNNKVYTIIN